MKNVKFPLRILLVAEREEHAAIVKQALASAGHSVASIVGPEDDVPTATQRMQPDGIVIELATPTKDFLRQLKRIYVQRPVPIVVFADKSADDDIRAAVKGGVSSYVVDGLRANRVVPVLEAAVTRFLEFQALRSERDEAVAKLSERRVIERAKGILMRRRDLPEDAAYEVLRKMAMNRGRRMIEVAESIITAEEALAQS